MIQTIRKFRIRSRELNLILLIFIPAAALCCMEFYTHVPWDLSIPVFLLNLGFYYLVYLFCSAVAGSWAGGYRAATLLFMAAGLTNYCVVSFRSSPIVPWDIYSIGTAFSVAGNYRLEITGKLILVLAGFLILAALGGAYRRKVSEAPCPNWRGVSASSCAGRLRKGHPDRSGGGGCGAGYDPFYSQCALSK